MPLPPISASEAVHLRRPAGRPPGVRQETALIHRVHLLDDPLLDVPRFVQPAVEVLGQLAVLGRRGPAEVVEGETEAAVDLPLPLVPPATVGPHVEPRLVRPDLGRGPVVVGGADEEYLFPLRSNEADTDIRWQQRACQIADVLDPVDVG